MRVLKNITNSKLVDSVLEELKGKPSTIVEIHGTPQEVRIFTNCLDIMGYYFHIDEFPLKDGIEDCYYLLEIMTKLPHKK